MNLFLTCFSNVKLCDFDYEVKAMTCALPEMTPDNEGVWASFRIPWYLLWCHSELVPNYALPPGRVFPVQLGLDELGHPSELIFLRFN